MSVNGYPGKNAYFNGNNLTGLPGLIITSIDINQAAPRINETYKIARANGQHMVSQYNDQKPIVIKGKFALDGLASMEAARDILMGYLSAIDAIFYTDVNGTPRQWKKVYCHQLDLENYSGGTMDVTITLMANDPFGYDMASTILVNNVTVTATPDSRSVTVGGTALVQLPIVTITINSFTDVGVGIPLIGFTNNTTGNDASYWAAFNPGDTIQWDALNEAFYYNGVRTTFLGSMPTLKPGINSLGLRTFDLLGTPLSAFNYTMKVEYTKRYQ